MKAYKKILKWITIIKLGTISLVVLVIFSTIGGLVSTNKKSSSSDTDFSAINISPEVEMYRSAVKKEAEANGIPETVDVLLALIMQESGGRHADLMQCSESQGWPPNTITDPYESIKIGVKYFAGNYLLAREKATKNKIETALQAYNYGNGFASWSIDREGGWTQENAIQFAKEKSGGRQRSNGEYAYGDQKYVEHVMRYAQPSNGSNGGTSIQPGGNKVIENAIKFSNELVGKTTYVYGGGRNQNDINRGVFDCSSYIHYVYTKAGIDMGELSSVTTHTLATKFKTIPTEQMKRGDLVFFDTDGRNGHIGIYLGERQFFNCETSKGVAIASLDNPYWSGVFNGLVVRVTE
ncbi:bifunctional lytic transglycosylase/C40 family peptidase [Carnobacterium maltaromaticum]|uniref:Bifunctional lytic transglycosylase/C40 family peptidase n=1 Tax=Carnobacterium maltaromaticum TaxID=2751 RepID=A0AAW9KA47_CARML|nr:bifunctional lytic transglycosylase/C40 family peptidase [Carnobacterium maltaromaticum]MDW5525207.1 bifunctional lytic transglycosylase/C40 family peptidase [Carnobacterium maltaromaticum]MDZ5760677.1 bifunctional lytic transglycosylase/C40 family peptidase [Carnobacterium maltaromaticum]